MAEISRKQLRAWKSQDTAARLRRKCRRRLVAVAAAIRLQEEPIEQTWAQQAALLRPGSRELSRGALDSPCLLCGMVRKTCFSKSKKSLGLVSLPMGVTRRCCTESLSSPDCLRGQQLGLQPHSSICRWGLCSMEKPWPCGSQSLNIP